MITETTVTATVPTPSPPHATIWALMWEGFRGLAGSKKFQAAVIGMIAFGVGKLGWQIGAETLALFLAPLWAAIIGQGIADVGKSAATVTATTTTRPMSAPFSKSLE